MTTSSYYGKLSTSITPRYMEVWAGSTRHAPSSLASPKPSYTRQPIDEVTEDYKGKTAGNLRQYTKNKPHRWGIKLFSRASEDGFITDIARPLSPSQPSTGNIQEHQPYCVKSLPAP